MRDAESGLPGLQAVLRLLLRDGWWVDLDTYLADRPGETKEAVYARRSKGYWRDGVECKVIKGAGLWVNVLAVNEWAGKSVCTTRGGSHGESER